MAAIVMFFVLIAFVAPTLAAPNWLDGWSYREPVTVTGSDLVAEWHFDEGSGNIVKDSSGNGNDGTIYGAAWAQGKLGKALRFDGSNDYVSVSDHPNLEFSPCITVEAWVNIDNYPAYAGNPYGPISCSVHRHVAEKFYI
jgi:hypothetical protein